MINSQNECLYVEEVKSGVFQGKPVLVLVDDGPRKRKAPHLFDEATAKYLLVKIRQYFPHLLDWLPKYEYPIKPSLPP